VVADGRPLNVQCTKDGGTQTIMCAGEIDVSTSDMLAEAISWAFTADLEELHIDLRGVTFLDSTGISCMVQAWRRCDRLGKQLTVNVLPGSLPERLLELAGVSGLWVVNTPAGTPEAST
jgi:anti-sigma B factor antagonist